MAACSCRMAAGADGLAKCGEEPTNRETEDALQIAKDCSDAILSRLPAEVRS